MFEQLPSKPTDALLGLMAAFRQDARVEKIDVGVGVYRNEQGDTPIMRAVKEAEKRLLTSQQSKTYVGMLGDASYNASMLQLIAGPLLSRLGGRIHTVQTAGGCAALRSLADLVACIRPDATVWMSDPTWLNHAPLMHAARLSIKTYPYFDVRKQAVDFDGMLACLKQRGPQDIVLLHGACHNPTGVDLSDDQWRQVADVAVNRGFLPFVDLAYQGLGRGIEEDAAAVRILASVVPEMLVAVSCSKSFGVYRERVGSAVVIGATAVAAKNMLDQMLTLIRGNYSMPPDHGANVVQLVLNTPDLKAMWLEELETMRVRIASLRTALVKQFQLATQTNQYDYIAQQYGMFSILGLESHQVIQLREKFGIYMPADSRTNIAGLKASQIPHFVKCVMEVTH